jgi:uncharacterized protein YjeT (DUF2065 family)
VSGEGASLGDLIGPALALMLIVEGLLPMLNPGGWRRVFERVLSMSDGQIRFVGMASIAMGLLWLAFLG